MRDIKDHKLNALPLTPFKQSRKPATLAEEKARSEKSLRSYNVNDGGGNDCA